MQRRVKLQLKITKLIIYLFFTCQVDPPYDLLTDNGEDDVGFDEILGPELDEEYDNVRSQGSNSDGEGSSGSERSEEHVIVIDKSQHAGSPKLYTGEC